MTLLSQSTYTLKRVAKESYSALLTPETIALPANSAGEVQDYANAKAKVQLTYDGKEIFPVYDERLDSEIGGRNYYKKGMKPSQPSETITTSMPEINGFKIEKTASGGTVRLSNVITDNGYWTVSFVVLASVGGYFRLDIADRGQTNFYFNANEPTYIELTAYNDRYGSVYHFIDFEQLPIGEFLIKNIKVEKGNKATDWTPAPEDVDASIALVQTNLNTHTLNTSNPHSVTKAQVGLGSVDNTADSAKNVLSATKLTTARTIWGQNFNGSANVTGALTGATTIAASTSVTTPKVIFAAAGWSLEQTGTELQMKYNGTAKMRFLSGGSIVATQEITAYS